MDKTVAKVRRKDYLIGPKWRYIEKMEKRPSDELTPYIPVASA
jgi:hypothetical protein